MGLFGIVVAAVLVGAGAKALGKANRPTWFGSTAGGIAGTKPTDPKIGMIVRMMVADPKRSGSYTATWESGSGSYKFQPTAIAHVKWTGTSKTNGLAIGKIVSIESYELGDPAPRKPLVGDTVLFD